MSMSAATDNVMWLFDSSAATDAGTSFMRTAIVEGMPIHEFFIDSFYFSWEWPYTKTSEQPIPTKGHLIKPDSPQRAGYQKLRLKNEYSGRRN